MIERYNGFFVSKEEFVNIKALEEFLNKTAKIHGSIKPYYSFNARVYTVIGLTINYYDLKRIPKQVLQFKGLKALNLNYNNLETLEGVEGLNRLEELHAAFNNIKNLEHLAGLKLKKVFLQGNDLDPSDSLFAELDRIDISNLINCS